MIARVLLILAGILCILAGLILCLLIVVMFQHPGGIGMEWLGGWHPLSLAMGWDLFFRLVLDRGCPIFPALAGKVGNSSGVWDHGCPTRRTHMWESSLNPPAPPATSPLPQSLNIFRVHHGERLRRSNLTFPPRIVILRAGGPLDSRANSFRTAQYDREGGWPTGFPPNPFLTVQNDRTPPMWPFTPRENV